jgi:signal peptidase II
MTSFVFTMKKALAVILVVLVADQALKVWIKTTMILGQEHVIFDWFIIHFTENVGMAFGMEFGGDYGKLALSLFRIVAVGAIGYYLYSITNKGASNIVIVALSLVFAGALGNIIDSTFYGLVFSDSYGQVANMFPAEGGYAGILYGRVVDMFYFPLIDGHVPSWSPIWPNKHFLFFNAIFNVADAAITVGMGMIILFQKQFLKEG